MNTALDQRDLVKAVRNYRAIDDKLKEVNTKTQKLREEKKTIESEMSDILRRANFQTINKLEIQDDGSYIKIQRPDTWNKPWSLSQKELKELIASYPRKQAIGEEDGLFRWIVEQKKTTMVAHEFSFTRVRSSNDNDGDEDAASGRVGARSDF